MEVLYHQMRKQQPEFAVEIDADERELATVFAYCKEYDDSVYRILKGQLRRVTREELQTFFRKSAKALFNSRVLSS